MDSAASLFLHTQSWSAFVRFLRRYDVYCASLSSAPEVAIQTNPKSCTLEFVWLAYMGLPTGVLSPLFDIGSDHKIIPGQGTTLERLKDRQQELGKRLKDSRADHHFAAFLGALSISDFKDYLWACADSQTNSEASGKHPHDAQNTTSVEDPLP